MNIGTLTGSIVLANQVSSVLDTITSDLMHFVTDSNKAFAAVAVGAGVVVSAITGITTSIIALGEKGSTILGVEDAFNRLAISAGSTGDALIKGLSHGVKETVDSMVLMQSTTRLLSSGMKLTGDQMELVGQTSRAMGRAAGTDATQGLTTLSTALATGQTRALKMAGIIVDVETAEKKLAAQLGVTRSELSEAGKLEARRNEILNAMRGYIDKVGVAELSFKERIEQSHVAISNWFDTLSKGVASSPAVNRAFDTIRDALIRAFGGDSQHLLDRLLVGVDKFANGVTKIAPPVIEAMAKVKDAILGVWNWLADLNDRFHITDTIVMGVNTAWTFLKGAFYFVRDAINAVMKAWQAMPDWLKRITEGSLKLGAGVIVAGLAVNSLASPVAGLIDKLDQGINIVGNFTTAIHDGSELLGNMGLRVGVVGEAWSRLLGTLGMAAPAIVDTTAALLDSKQAATLAATGMVDLGNSIVAYNVAGKGTVLVTKDIIVGMSAAGLAVNANAVANVNLVAGMSLAGAQATKLTFATKAVVAAQVFWTAALERTGITLAITTAQTKLSAAADLASANASKVAAAAKYIFEAAIIRTGLAGVYTTAKNWLLSASNLAVAASAKLATGGTIAFGTALWALQAVPIIAVITGVSYVLYKLVDAFNQARKASDNFKEFFINTGHMIMFGNIIKSTGEQAQTAVTGYDEAAEAAKRLRKDLSGEALANEVHNLHMSFIELDEETRSTAFTINRVGERAQALREQGARLHPELILMADGFLRDKKAAEELALASGGLSKEFIKADTSAEDFGKKVRDLGKALTTIYTDTAVFAAAFKNLTPPMLANEEVIKRLVPKIEEFANAGGLVTAEMRKTYEAGIANKVALQATVEATALASGGTLEYIETQKALGVSEATIALRLHMMSEQLGIYTNRLEQVRKVSDDLIKTQDQLFSARNAAQIQRLAPEQQIASKSVTNQFESGIISAEEAAQAQMEITEKFAARKLELDLEGVNKSEEIARRELQRQIDFGELAFASKDQIKQKSDAIGAQAELSRTQLMMAEADRRIGIQQDADSVIIALQRKELDDYDRMTMTSTQYQVAQIRKVQAERISQLKGSPAQIKAATDLIIADSNRQTKALMTNWDALKALSTSNLRDIAETARNTYNEALTRTDDYSDAALKILRKAAEEAERAWSKAAKNITYDFKTAMALVSKYSSDAGNIFSAIASSTGSKWAETASQIMSAVQDVTARLAEGDWIGAIISGVTHAIQMLGDAIIDSAGERTMRAVGRLYGVAITEELGDTIAQQSKELFGGNRDAAALFNLDAIMTAGGGLSNKNINTMTERLTDLFRFLEEGAYDSAEAVAVLNKNFGVFADYFKGGLISKELKEVVRLTREAGLESQAVIEFLKDQADLATSGISMIIDAQVKGLDDLLDKRETASKDALAQIDKEINGLRITQEEYNRLGRLGVAALGAAVDAGVPFLEALDSMSDQFDDLNAAQRAFNLSTGAGFAELGGIQKFFKANEDLAGSIVGTEQALRGLYNGNRLTQESFTDLAAVAVGDFNKMIAGGLTTNQAFLATSDTLQTLWEIVQDGSFVADDATKKLLAEAEAAGRVGDSHRSAAERSVQAMERAAEALELVAKNLEHIFDPLARGADQAARDVRRSLESIPTDLSVNVAIDRSPFSSTSRGFETGTPGLMPMQFGSGTKVTLHGEETVVPTSRMDEFMQRYGQMGGSRGEGGGDVYMNVEAGAVVVDGANKDVSGLANEIAAALVAKARRGESFRNEMRLVLGVR